MLNRYMNSRNSQQQLLNYINEVSFAVNDISLYLDTHPDCMEGMEFFREHSAARNEALAEYARLYGPLTIDTADDASSESWEWIKQPFPWEVKGACR